MIFHSRVTRCVWSVMQREENTFNSSMALSSTRMDRGSRWEPRKTGNFTWETVPRVLQPLLKAVLRTLFETWLAKGKRIASLLLRSQTMANHRGSRKYKVSRSEAGRDNENFDAGSRPWPAESVTKRSVLPMTVPEEVSWQKDLQGLGWLRSRGTGGCLVARETKGNKTKSWKENEGQKEGEKRGDNKKMRSCAARKRSRRGRRKGRGAACNGRKRKVRVWSKGEGKKTDRTEGEEREREICFKNATSTVFCSGIHAGLLNAVVCADIFVSIHQVYKTDNAA